MNISMHTFTLILVTLTLLLPVDEALSQSKAPSELETLSQGEVEAKLRALEEELSKYKEMLESTQGQKSEVEETLKRNEKGISDLIKKIDRIETDLDTKEDKVSQLTSDQAELQTAKSQQQGLIEGQVRAAYEIGNQEYLKVLLNQEDPNEVARMLVYYDYFNMARAEQISRYNETMKDLDRVSQELVKETEQLARNKTALVAEQTSLALIQREKKSSLKALIREIRKTGTEISKLNQDRGRLEQLLERLENSLANLPTPGDASPFSGMRGKLIMPAEGRISQRFGNRRNAGKLTWDGVFIDADEGEPVYAVHYGRVVFSDWLRGFGLLLIISHGEGYMSLYGHNQVLYRETGEWVTAGDMIATVGNSGGQNKTGLYFEIRIAGKPSDPQKWCVAREQRAA